MSLIHQVLKDLDGQREVTPGEIIGYADHENNHRVMIWPALVISILAAVFVLYFSQYFESDPSVINRSSLPVIPVTGKNPAVVPVIAEGAVLLGGVAALSALGLISRLRDL